MNNAMKKMSRLVIGAALFTAVTAEADFYESKPYVGGNISDQTLSAEGESGELSLVTGYARFGARFGDYFSLEWRIGTGLQEDDIRVSDTRVDASLDLLYGAYVLGGFPVTGHIYPYALIGYTRTELELSRDISTTEYEDNDISYGVGVNFDVSDTFAINLEYLQYLKENGVELAGPSLGFLFYF